MITKTGCTNFHLYLTYNCSTSYDYFSNNIFYLFITFMTEIQKYNLNYCMSQTLYRFMTTKQDCEHAQGNTIYEGL